MINVVTNARLTCNVIKEWLERLPALHYSVDLFSCPFRSWVSSGKFEIIRGSLMRP